MAVAKACVCKCFGAVQWLRCWPADLVVMCSDPTEAGDLKIIYLLTQFRNGDQVESEGGWVIVATSPTEL